MNKNRATTRATLLVVDDDDATRSALVGLLESEGYTTLSARNGTAALAVMRESSSLPDLVILDVQMLEMDGRAFRAAQCADDTLRAVPVLVITAEPKTRDHASTFGAPVLYKPFGAGVLFEAVARELKQSDVKPSGVYPTVDERLIRRRDSA